MRRLLISLAALFCVALVVAGYMFWPLATAWRIREAIRGGEADYLADKIEWSSLKRTLKPSLMQIAMPPKAAVTAVAGVDGPPAKPGLWQRFKNYLGESAVDRMIEAYVTPEGLPQLFQYGKTYREKIKGEDDPATHPLAERISRFWSRVLRAEFTSLDRFELEMRDRGEPPRVYTGVLEFRGLEWKLTGLTVRQQEALPTTNADAGADKSVE